MYILATEAKFVTCCLILGNLKGFCSGAWALFVTVYFQSSSFHLKKDGGYCLVVNFLWGHGEFLPNSWSQLVPPLICVKCLWVKIVILVSVEVRKLWLYKKRHMHVLRLHISIQSLTNEHVSSVSRAFWLIIFTNIRWNSSHLYKACEKKLCRTDQNRNVNQSGSNRWYVCRANFFPLLSFVDFTPPSQWLWVMIRWADVATCCSSSPFICLYPSFLLFRRLVKLLEHLAKFFCWLLLNLFSPLSFK